MCEASLQTKHKYLKQTYPLKSKPKAQTQGPNMIHDFMVSVYKLIHTSYQLYSFFCVKVAAGGQTISLNGHCTSQD